MPTAHDIYTAARSTRDEFNNTKRSGRADEWGDTASEGFAIRYGFYVAFKDFGFDVDKAAHFAHVLASKTRIPDLYLGDRSGKNWEVFYYHQFNTAEKTVDSVLMMLSGDTGRWVGDDEDPRAGLDDPEPVDGAVIIDLGRIRARMLASFEFMSVDEATRLTRDALKRIK